MIHGAPAPRVLWVGDSPTVSSGFARCTREVCAELHSAGWDVHVLGINHYGDPHAYPYFIYPCRNPVAKGRDAYGTTRLPHLIKSLSPDIVVILQDPWNIPEYFDQIDITGVDISNTPIVGWIAVDGKNQDGKGLNRLSYVVTWTRFAQEELISGGYTGYSSIVPLGIDTSLFYPRDRAESRALVCPENMPPDAFIVGVVGRNQIRKRLDLTLEYFAEWVQSCNIADAYLYLHVAPTGDLGCDLKSLVRYYGLSGRVIIPDQSIGTGQPDIFMPNVYSAFDVYLTTTQGEGWGLPTMEAMACGVPCIVPDWSALGEWPGSAVIKVPCTSTCLTAPINSLAYTIGGVPDKWATVRALNGLYNSDRVRDIYRQRGLELVSRPEYQWSNIGTRFRETLEMVMREMNPMNPESVLTIAAATAS